MKVVAPREEKMERGGREEARRDAAKWPRVRLSSVCRVQNGWAFDGEGFSTEKGTPLIRIRDLKTNVCSLRFVGEYPKEYAVRNGDLLIGMDGEFRCYRWSGGDALLNQRVCRLLPDGERVAAGYLHYLLDEFLREIEDRTAFTTVKHLSSRDVEALEIPLPPLAEQERIAGLLTEQLGAVERARAAAAQRLAAAEALPAALLREVFDGPQASGWETRTIDDFAKTCSGATPSRGNAAYFGGAIPWVKTGELRDGFVGDDGSTEESVTEAALRDCSLPLLPPGTLLIAMYGQGKTRGRTGILTREATTNQACFAILPDPDVFDTGFLQLWFRANYHDLRAMTENRGGNQPNLNGVLLRELEIPLPDAATQRRLAADLGEKLAAAEGVIARCRDELAAIEALPAALLRDAFGGSPAPGDGEGA